MPKSTSFDAVDKAGARKPTEIRREIRIKVKRKRKNKTFIFVSTGISTRESRVSFHSISNISKT